MQETWVNFNGTNNQLAVTLDNPDFSNGFTLAAWVYPVSTAGFGTVMGYHPSQGTLSRSPSLYVYNGTRIHAGFGTGSKWNSFMTGSVLTMNEWNYVAYTFDGTT